MEHISQSTSTYEPRNFSNLRRMIVVVSLALQLFVLGAVLVSMQQPQTPDLSLTPVAGKPGVCQVVAVRPFSDAWVHGVQAGIQVRITSPGQNSNCEVVTQTIQLQLVGMVDRTVSVSVLAPPVDFGRIAIGVILALIFNVTGIAIFLRAQNRLTAHLTYALFSCTALSLCLFNLHSTNALWINLLSFILAMMIRGLSATFVCLFPYSSEQSSHRRRARLLPYVPLLAGLFLAALSLPMPLASPPIGFAFITVSFAYNILCVLIAIGIMVWGLGHLSRQERQFTRMVVIGIIFLLFPLALGLNLVNPDRVIEQGLLSLVPIPMAVLPVACIYGLFRTQLLGATSLLSRQAMRILLWILLASVFVFSTVILLRTVSTLGIPQQALDYIYASLLVVSLALFPFVWNKVRDAGDQVLYGDFYEYNRSLRDLSAALTQLQGIEQISAFMLPRLATLLNATETSLLLRATQPAGSLPSPGAPQKTTSGWRIYRHLVTWSNHTSGMPEGEHPDEWLAGIANLALMHLEHGSSEPILLDGMYLLPLHDSSQCSGFLSLGPKFNLEPYGKQDASFLSTLASQLSVLEVNSRYLKQAQADAQQLAALNHRVISAQEEERRHLAFELHDEALQQAMLVVRQLSDASTMTEVAEVMPLARCVVAGLRRTCLELRPPLLDELGLEEAFRWLARQTEGHSSNQLQIQILCTGCWETRPPANIELALYRVAQEALSNMFKYASASRAVIRLRRKQDGAISLLISDNGRGLQQKQRQAENLGLVGMHERMTAIGGTLNIRTSPGRGVIIRATCCEQTEKASAIVPASQIAPAEQEPALAHSYTLKGVRS
jgi:signal transduction histidine kinase